jgi:SAM-dependent methyltransferase
MFKKPDDEDIHKQLSRRKKELKKLFGLPQYKQANTDKKFLDYGGGTGVAYKAARELGLNTYYHDIDEEARRFTCDKFDLPREKTIQDLETSDEKFDYIFSDNVIEHVRDPVHFTDVLARHLRKKGVLVIKTPLARNTATYFNPIISIKGYLIRAMRYNGVFKTFQGYSKRFWHCDPPKHLYSFSPKSLEIIAENVAQREFQYEVFYYRTPAFSNTLTRAFFTKDKRLGLARSIAVRLLIWPLIPIEVLMQLIRWLLLETGILSPEGVILLIRNSAAQTTSGNSQ